MASGWRDSSVAAEPELGRLGEPAVVRAEPGSAAAPGTSTPGPSAGSFVELAVALLVSASKSGIAAARTFAAVECKFVVVECSSDFQKWFAVDVRQRL